MDVSKANTDRLLKLTAVCEVTGLSRSMLYRMIAAEEFPPPRKIGPKASRWLQSEIAGWMAALPRAEL